MTIALDRPVPRADHEGTVDVAAAPDRRRELAGTGLALAILATFAAVRLDATALWLDEAYSLGAANHLGASLRQTSGTMGGYYALLSGWATLSTDTWWLRLLSVAFAAAALVALRPIARRIGGPRLVAVALPLAALNIALAAKAVEARSYALVGLLTVLSWRVAISALDAPDERTRRRRLALLAPLALAGTACHGLFLVQFAGIGVVLALAGRPLRRLAELGALALPAVGLVLLLRSNGADSIGTTVSGGPGVLVASTFDALLARAVLPKLVLAQLVAVGVALAVRSAARSAPSADRAVAAIPAAWAILPCLALGALVFDPVYNPRYLAPVAPGLALLLGTLVLAADDAIRGRLGRTRPAAPLGAGPVLGPAVVALGLLAAGVLATTPPVIDDDWRGAAAHVAAATRPGDGIVFANLGTWEPVQQRPPFEAAWREVGHDRPPTAISPARPLAEVRRKEPLLALDELVPATTGTRRLWVVENQATGVRQMDPILAELEGSFEEVDRRTFTPGIVVVLLERR